VATGERAIHPLAREPFIPWLKTRGFLAHFCKASWLMSRSTAGSVRRRKVVHRHEYAERPDGMPRPEVACISDCLLRCDARGMVHLTPGTLRLSNGAVALSTSSPRVRNNCVRKSAKRREGVT
jgi:hypothetical protein